MFTLAPVLWFTILHKCTQKNDIKILFFSILGGWKPGSIVSTKYDLKRSTSHDHLQAIVDFLITTFTYCMILAIVIVIAMLYLYVVKIAIVHSIMFKIFYNFTK